MRKAYPYWQLGLLVLLSAQTAFASDWHEREMAQGVRGDDYYAADRNISLADDVKGGAFTPAPDDGAAATA